MRRRAAMGLALSALVSLAAVCAWPLVQEHAAVGNAPARARAVPSQMTAIVTAAPEYVSLAALHGSERFPQGAELMLLRDGRLKPLLPEFAASADASVSFDGRSVLFSGKKQSGDPWQIWEFSLKDGTSRLIIGGAADSIRPMWLPGGQLVYAQRQGGRFELETAALNGSGARPLAYVPGNFIPDDVLLDGRVLFESGFPLGAGNSPEMYAVYPDGGGVESIRCDHLTAERRGGREHGRQLASGDIVFAQGGRLARFTSALADEASIAAPAGDYSGDVAELPDGRWLLSAKKPGQHLYSLAVWEPGTAALSPVAADSRRNLIEPVVMEQRTAPKLHPSGLQGGATGNLLAMNARLTRDGSLRNMPARVRLETLSGSGRPVVLGTAPVAKDGSFFARVEGNEPIRIILLDAENRTIRREQGWFWVARGEQRVCVGCHTGPERAPDNRVPEILDQSTTPVDLTRTGSLTAGGH